MTGPAPSLDPGYIAARTAPCYSTPSMPSPPTNRHWSW